MEERYVQFDLDHGVEILSRTPATLNTLLRGLSAVWTRETEGGESWSPFDIIGHLIQGEEANWIPRATTILSFGENREFDPFDRLAQFKASEGKSLEDLLDRFEVLRRENLATLSLLDLSPADLERTGLHPDFGQVTLGQLLSTWVAHDLGHIGQIVRVMARQYAEEVGPWKAYLPVLTLYRP